MNLYALTETASGNIREIREFDSQPPLLNEAKGVQWQPYTPPVPVPPTMDELKTTKRSSINEIRANLETSGFMYLDKLFDSDQRSAGRIQVAAIAAQSALMAGQPFSLDWTTADNSIITLDAAGVLGMIGAFASRGLALHETAKTLKAQADAATTKEELDAIVWPV